MKKLKLFCVLIAAAVATTISAGNTPFKQKVKGQVVQIQFYTPSIVRICLTPSQNTDEKNSPEGAKRGSYSIILKPEDGMKVTVTQQEQDGRVTLSSSLLKVTLDTSTGAVMFQNTTGNTLLQTGDTRFTVREGDSDAGRLRTEQDFLLEKDEAIFGLGQLRDPAMNQRGRDIDIWNRNTYISIPYFTSVKGYGVYWDNAGRSHFSSPKLGEEGRATFTSEVAEGADYYFIYGGSADSPNASQDGVIAGIRQLTGQATMFPLWAMGHWQCRERYKTSDELAGVLDKYRSLQIPLDAIVQDWQYWGCDSNWNAMRFMNPYYINKVGDATWSKYLPGDMRKMKAQSEPRLKSPEEMVKYVHQNNAHLMITIWPDFGPWTDQFKKLEKINGLLPFETWPRNAGVKVYDAFNPKARELYWQYLSHLYKMGLDAWWTDSTEPDEFDEEKNNDFDYLTHDGSWRSVHNAFPLVHNKSIYEHQRSMKDNMKRSLQMTRSGAFGIQHYGTFSWSGDIQASWQEMKAQVPSGLNYTLCGIPFWNTDLGGFFYWDYWNNPKNPALKELQTRWMEWGTFMPLMRNHCSSPMVSEIYEMGEEGDWAYDAIKSFIQLRYRLLPYIYSNAGECVQRSGSMMRPFVMDFPADKTAINLNDEYMFGHALLVKPVTDALYTWKEDNRHGHEIYPDIKKASAPVSVYLPTAINNEQLTRNHAQAGKAGNSKSSNSEWYDFWTNERIEGGKTILRACPIDIMPVYVRAGSILPFGPEVQYSNEKPWDELEIRVYPGADGNFTLYEDEGDNYNYEKGQFTEIPFTWNETSRTLNIGQRKGSFKGMLQQRTFRIVLVGKDSGIGSQPMKVNETITYNGKEISVKL